MNNLVPAFYPEIPQEVDNYLRVLEEVVIPECIPSNDISIVTPKIGSSALLPSYAIIGHIIFCIYKSKEDVWMDAYYDAWYYSEDRNDIYLLTDLATKNVKSLEWWSV